MRGGACAQERLEMEAREAALRGEVASLERAAAAARRERAEAAAAHAASVAEAEQALSARMAAAQQQEARTQRGAAELAQVRSLSPQPPRLCRHDTPVHTWGGRALCRSRLGRGCRGGASESSRQLRTHQ